MYNHIQLSCLWLLNNCKYETNHMDLIWIILLYFCFLQLKQVLAYCEENSFTSAFRVWLKNNDIQLILPDLFELSTLLCTQTDLAILWYKTIRQGIVWLFFTSDSTCRQGQYYYTHINDLSESCLQSYCCCCSPHFQNSLSLIQPAACFTCLPVYIYIYVCVCVWRAGLMQIEQNIQTRFFFLIICTYILLNLVSVIQCLLAK